MPIKRNQALNFLSIFQHSKSAIFVPKTYLASKYFPRAILALISSTIVIVLLKSPLQPKKSPLNTTLLLLLHDS
jgi:hypothetical protein